MCKKYFFYRAIVLTILIFLPVSAGAGSNKTPVDVKVTPPAEIGLPPTVLPAYAQRPGRMIDVGGYRLNLYCFGSGSPAVILDAGAGWGGDAWGNIQRKIAKNARVRVCSYDRAGINFSERGPSGRTPADDTRDLHSLLKNAKVKGPYVLVGWSAGGMIIRRYAYEHPEQVVGLVTVDGSTFDYADLSQEAWYAPERITKFFNQCIDAARTGKFADDTKLYHRCAQTIQPLDFIPEMHTALLDYVNDPAAYGAMLAAFLRTEKSGEELRTMRKSYGDLPLRVIVAGTHFSKDASKNSPIVNPTHVRYSYQIAALSKNGRMIVIPGTSHAAHLERPKVIMDIIEGVIRHVRAKR